ncbi:MAG: hypothetical protein E7349_00345 [Clostridiales bacterium]|nr:hypothetical protein [Clostridiales bacterium]
MKKFLAAIFAFVMCLALVACVPADLDKAEDKMEEAGYKVTVMSGDAAELLYGEEVVGLITATKAEGSGILNTKTYTVNAVLFESSKAAKDYAEDKDDVEVSGKWAISGDEEAIKAFKK